ARRGYGAAPLVLAPAGHVPPRLIPSTTAAVSGAAPVPPSVSLITEGVLAAMRTAKLQLAAAVVAAAGLLGLAGVGAYTALAQDPPPAANPADPPAPKAEPGGTGEWIVKDLAGAIPTAFPDLGPPPRPEEDCPRLFGKEPVVVDARDDTYRKLLKARLQLARLGFARAHGYLGQRGAPAGAIVRTQMQLLGEIREVVMELWAADPAGSVPWLEESVRMTKLYDGTVDTALQAVNPGDATFFHLVEVRRHRLAAEADLWKAKNRPAAKGGGPGR
ncbi:MAG: hypothetical protein K2X82_14530, partial [Gemmataceae bacterium]|nr:hypothetical protein [Gemmataceae bacterium]